MQTQCCCPLYRVKEKNVCERYRSLVKHQTVFHQHVMYMSNGGIQQTAWPDHDILALIPIMAMVQSTPISISYSYIDVIARWYFGLPSQFSHSFYIIIHVHTVDNELPCHSGWCPLRQALCSDQRGSELRTSTVIDNCSHGRVEVRFY